MNHYLLIYHYVGDYMNRRGTYREEHLRLAREAYDRGELIMAGALADPPDKAVLVFRSLDVKAIESFIQNDPYVKSGIVAHWEIRPWTVVIG